MSSFREKFPELISANPGGTFDPLGESILKHSQAWFRVFEPADIRIVIGRNQDPTREVNLEIAQQDQVPVHRRASGGGTVVLSPGSLVIAVRMCHEQVGVNCYFADINRCLVQALQTCGVMDAACYGHGDLALQENGQTLKILGASLRQSNGAVYYLGVMMVENLIPLIERYLPMPSKQPDYRGDRSHADFCTYLAQRGLHVGQVKAALEAQIQLDLTVKALLD